MAGHRNQEFHERRARDDEATRLTDEVPLLATLRFEIWEDRSGRTIGKHARPIIVQRAPARFEFACGDEVCREGGHDLTYEVMSELKAEVADFSGQSACCGQTGSAPCSRVLHYVGAATYAH